MMAQCSQWGRNCVGCETVFSVHRQVSVTQTALLTSVTVTIITAFKSCELDLKEKSRKVQDKVDAVFN